MAVITPYVPSNITVHMGAPNEPAENITVSFADYVKNVTSSEIYPTWEQAAIEANILAITSFALNRVYTEFYRGQGYPFDITAVTATDQKFIKGQTVFENIGQLVDEMFNDYLRKEGFIEPLSSKFCNGTTTLCDGLSQWGSQELAEAGYSTQEILRYYYGDDIEVVYDAPIQDIEESYPGTPLRLGSVGEDVVVVQASINRIAQDYPAIPKISPVTGIYNEQTEASVKRFQEIFGLTPDGIVGKATWYRLARIYVAVTDLAQLVSEGQQFTSVSFAFPGTLREGDRGEDVKVLQYMLSVVAEFNKAIPFVAIDGIFGASTTAAVKAFQRSVGLTDDGIVGRQTWEDLYNEFVGIDEALRDNNINFPYNETASIPATSMNGESIPDLYHDTTRHGQYPGYELELGASDGKEVTLV